MFLRSARGDTVPSLFCCWIRDRKKSGNRIRIWNTVLELPLLYFYRSYLHFNRFKWKGNTGTHYSATKRYLQFSFVLNIGFEQFVNTHTYYSISKEQWESKGQLVKIGQAIENRSQPKKTAPNVCVPHRIFPENSNKYYFNIILSLTAGKMAMKSRSSSTE